MVHRVTIALAVLLASFGLNSCNGVGADAERPAVPAEARLELKLDRAVEFDGLVLSWISVEDSRCPQGVMCVWAGEATVRIRVRDGSDDREVALTLEAPPGGESVKSSRHEFRLVAVEPYPRLDATVAQDAQRATVVVKRRLPEQLCRHWVQSYEEQQPDAAERIFRPADYKSFPPSRFRMQYKFACDGTCEWYSLSPDDAHRFEAGSWSIDAEDGAVLRITAGGTTEAYKIAELTDELLRLVPIEAATGR